MRTSLWILAMLGVVLLAMQFVRPDLTNPAVTAELQVPSDVKEILKTSCYNCHSNETKLSWFDEPVPAYWLVAKHVREGRKHLNFSEIGNLPHAQQQAILFECVSQIELGAMPVPAYERLHRESVVTAEKLAILKKYLGATNQPVAAAEVHDSDTEYEKWIQGGSGTHDVQPVANGIAFIPEYKDWRTISSTERFDNHNLRLVLGNDVAVKAIAENHIDPWPDGTIFAKVAWFQQEDASGLVRAGKFFQVEFMIRESKKYASTLGWGFARWRGADLKPYGKDAAFAEECVTCHSPLTKTNYVFTTPIRGQQ